MQFGGTVGIVGGSIHSDSYCPYNSHNSLHSFRQNVDIRRKLVRKI